VKTSKKERFRSRNTMSTLVMMHEKDLSMLRDIRLSSLISNKCLRINRRRRTAKKNKKELENYKDCKKKKRGLTSLKMLN
jgi:hypothetical protein